MRCFASFRIATSAVLGCAILNSCGDATGPDDGRDRDPPDVRVWVTEELSANLDAKGHFVLPTPQPVGAEPIISPETAAQLAMAYVQTFLWNDDAAAAGFETLSRVLEREHGRNVDWLDVRPLPERTYYAGGAYQELPAAVPLFVRRAFGRSYQIPLVSGGNQVALLTVAAHSTDTSIDADGTLVLPRVSGGEFDASGIPWNLATWVPLSPEEAVRIAATTTGARVRRLPRLTRMGDPVASYFAKWEIVLDRPVTLRMVDTGETRSSDTVFLGAWADWKIEWFLPKRVQPEGDTILYSAEDGDHLVYARFRDDVSVTFDHVLPVNN